MPDNQDYEFLRTRFGHYSEVVERMCKGRPIGIPVEDVKENFIYVLDWRAEEPDNFSSLTVDYVTKIRREESINTTIVESRGADCDIETFARLVVAGPFPL